MGHINATNIHSLVLNWVFFCCFRKWTNFVNQCGYGPSIYLEKGWWCRCGDSVRLNIKSQRFEFRCARYLKIISFSPTKSLTDKVDLWKISLRPFTRAETDILMLVITKNIQLNIYFSITALPLRNICQFCTRPITRFSKILFIK